VALFGILQAGGICAAFGGKGWQIAAPTPLPQPPFRQQTQVVEHNGGIRLGVFGWFLVTAFKLRVGCVPMNVHPAWDARSISGLPTSQSASGVPFEVGRPSAAAS
jgi:hypothetical protein